MRGHGCFMKMIKNKCPFLRLVFGTKTINYLALTTVNNRRITCHLNQSNHYEEDVMLRKINK